MIRGRVVGQVWMTRRLKSVPSGAMLEIELTQGGRLVAFDPLGCALGEDVVLVQGSVAAAHFEKPGATVDAIIVGSIDEDRQSETRKTAGRSRE